MPIINDQEFGKITVRRSSRASQVSLKVAPDGTLRASLPIYAPVFLVRHLIKNSRDEIRKLLAKAKPAYIYENGMQIGKSHVLIIQYKDIKIAKAIRHGQQIIINLPIESDINNPSITRTIREAVISALRLEAKSYLPRRLDYLASQFGFRYDKLRFSHSSGRWGSCSSSGTISLNIALMKLPFELIDYVIIHELAHTKQMNHSQEFWSVVKLADPNYKYHRKALKLNNPTI